MKTIAALLCTLALAGCGDSKQAKLEKCMDTAERKFIYVSTYGTGKTDGSVCDIPDKNMSTLCGQVRELAKQTRLEEEERCVKLYK